MRAAMVLQRCPLRLDSPSSDRHPNLTCDIPLPYGCVQLLVELAPAPAEVGAGLGHKDGVDVYTTHAVAATVHSQGQGDQALIAAHIQHISTFKPRRVQHLAVIDDNGQQQQQQ